MKRFIVFITLLFFIKPVFPVLDFVINYEAIQEICVNKNTPSLQCNGSCYLKNNLAKAAHDDNPFAEKKSFQLHLEVLFFNPFDWEHLEPAQPKTSKKVADSYNTLYAYLAADGFQKPPSL